MNGKYPKDLKVKEKCINREDGTKIRTLLCYPNQKENAIGVLLIHDGGYALSKRHRKLLYYFIMNKNNANYYGNLPPTNTFVGNIEPFYDETIGYIENLKKARINTKVDIHDGCFHAFALFGSKKN